VDLLTGFQFLAGAVIGFFSSPLCRDWLWGPLSLQSNWCWRLSPQK